MIFQRQYTHNYLQHNQSPLSNSSSLSSSTSSHRPGIVASLPHPCVSLVDTAVRVVSADHNNKWPWCSGTLASLLLAFEPSLGMRNTEWWLSAFPITLLYPIPRLTRTALLEGGESMDCIEELLRDLPLREELLRRDSCLKSFREKRRLNTDGESSLLGWASMRERTGLELACSSLWSVMVVESRIRMTPPLVPTYRKSPPVRRDVTRLTRAVHN